MGDEPILPVIQPITINTMLNNNGPNIIDGINFITCERSFSSLKLTKLAFNYKVTSLELIDPILKVHLFELSDLTLQYKFSLKSK